MYDGKGWLYIMQIVAEIEFEFLRFLKKFNSFHGFDYIVDENVLICRLIKSDVTAEFVCMNCAPAKFCDDTSMSYICYEKCTICCVLMTSQRICCQGAHLQYPTSA